MSVFKLLVQVYIFYRQVGCGQYYSLKNIGMGGSDIDFFIIRIQGHPLTHPQKRLRKCIGFLFCLYIVAWQAHPVLAFLYMFKALPCSSVCVN